VLLALVACRGEKSAPSREGSAAPPAATQPRATGSADPGHCEPQPFALSTPLPEASGAAWLTIDGRLVLAIVSDSGNDGAYALLDPETGETREQGKLPLGGGSDDIEGFAAHGARVFGLSSGGWMRVWKRSGTGFALVDGPYAIGTQADGMTCSPKQGCKINYEGLALAATPQHGCAGVACSKGDGGVYCLTEKDGRYAIDPARRIAVTKPGVLADCTFDDADQLWAGNNIFGMDQVFRIDGWGDAATAKVVATNAFGVGFSEVIAARGNVIYRMSDTGGAPSLMGKFRCSATSR
jgi:hypothetical protein